MKTAIVTGASSGLGCEFVKSIQKAMPEIECFWLIARRREKMETLAAELRLKNAVILPLDLCDGDSFRVYAEKLATEKPDIRMLVNNAGWGFLGNVEDLPPETWNKTIDLNVKALTEMTALSLPYMAAGAHIVNVSSIASFCSNPRMTVYSSTKAYVSSFTLGLREELRPRRIGVTAVCPGPMATEFTSVGKIDGNSKMFETLPPCDPAKVAEGTVKAALKGRTFHTPRSFFKFYRFVAKVVPHAALVKITKT